MRHGKHSSKFSRTASHRRCLMANLLKSLIDDGKIETTEAKAKELRRYADRMITLAKQGTLAADRRLIAKLMVRYNQLTCKERRLVKTSADTRAYNRDRKVLPKLKVLAERYKERQGGYTRITKMGYRVGDNSSLCLVEYI